MALVTVELNNGLSDNGPVVTAVFKELLKTGIALLEESEGWGYSKAKVLRWHRELSKEF